MSSDGNSGPGWSGVILVSLIVSVGVVFGARWATEQGLLPGPGAHTVASPQEEPPVGKTAQVPPIVGMSLGAATELLQARGLTVRVRAKRGHEMLPADSVIEQDPLPGSVLPFQSPVEVTLSTGQADNTQVPKLTGESVNEATRILTAAGLQLGVVSGPATGERVVLTTDPPEGAAVARGTKVALTVSLVGVTVPKLVGIPWPRAKKLLEEAGLEVGKVRERYNEYRDDWVVLEQSPEAGTSVAEGSKVDIVRNEGDEY